MFRRIIALMILTLVVSAQSWAQCAMCRSTLENNVSNGEATVAAGVNAGILYLFVMPYLMVFIIGLLWYKNSRGSNSRSLFLRLQKK